LPRPRALALDPLEGLAARYFAPRTCGFWWRSLTQPDRIVDATLELDVGRCLLVASLRVFTDVIFSSSVSSARRRFDARPSPAEAGPACASRCPTSLGASSPSRTRTPRRGPTKSHVWDHIERQFDSQSWRCRSQCASFGMALRARACWGGSLPRFVKMTDDCGFAAVPKWNDRARH
jgi:hypothetical protein